MDSGKTRVIRGSCHPALQKDTTVPASLAHVKTFTFPRRAHLFRTAAAVLPVNPQIFRLFPLSLRGYCFSSYTPALTLPLHQCSAVTTHLTHTTTLSFSPASPPDRFLRRSSPGSVHHRLLTPGCIFMTHVCVKVW